MRQEPLEEIADLRAAGVPIIALAGNPNVGKSTIFNSLTGGDVSTAHYAGTTTEITVGTTLLAGQEICLVDLPGTYALGTPREEARVARRALLELKPDAVIAVVDATNLARNLFLLIQVLELAVPVVVALNLTDEAERSGLRIDAACLTERLGVAVVPCVATQGLGLEPLMDLALAVASTQAAPEPLAYDEAIERAVTSLAAVLADAGTLPFALTSRAAALLLLEGDQDVETALPHTAAGGAAHRMAAEQRVMLSGSSQLSDASLAIARARHAIAHTTARSCTQSQPPKARGTLWSFATSPVTGIPLLGAVLATVFAFLFFIGDLLSRAFSALWAVTASPVLQAVIHRLFGEGALAHTLLWGFDSGIEASLAIGLPYILTFYVLLSVLEDSGYLNSVAFLADRVMHRFGLHGWAVIPIVSGAGCSVPAVLSLRSMPTMREKTIAATLVTFVPCSARTAVILGAVAHYVGWAPALGVYAITAGVAVAAGLGLDAMMPGESRGLVMEMFPFRRPSVAVVGHKAWFSFREFLTVAIPIVFVGSLVLGGLYETGLLVRLSAPLSPLVEGWLGLPAVAGVTLVLGLLRKELALQLLVTVAVAMGGAHVGNISSFMSSRQLVVFALVNTLAIPCISTVSVLGKTLGWRRTAGVVALTVGAALLVGGIVSRLLPFVGLS